MSFNQLPEGYEGPQKRRTEFGSEQEKLQYDAKNLLGLARVLYGKKQVTVHDVFGLASREDDDVEVLRKGVAVEIKGRSAAEPDTLMEGKKSAEELLPEQAQKWFGELKARFDAFPQLHKGIQWEDVEKLLKADPESMKKLQSLDEKGHNMNVFGEEDGEFVFASAWSSYEQVSPDHRNLAYDAEGQRLAKESGYKPNGNAVRIIAKIMGVKEDEATNYLADPKFHEQLRQSVAINGWAWLKTDVATRKIGYAFNGHNFGIYRGLAGSFDDDGSFRAVLRVKKA